MKQTTKSKFNPKDTIIVKGLTVKNPYAWMIANGQKTIEVRSRNTSYRGKIYITSSKKPEIREMKNGFLMCSADLVRTKPVKEFTEQDFIATGINESEWGSLRGFGWYLENVQKTELIPTNGQLGIYNIYLKDERLKTSYQEKIPKKLSAIIITSIIILIILSMFLINHLSQ